VERLIRQTFQHRVLHLFYTDAIIRSAPGRAPRALPSLFTSSSQASNKYQSLFLFLLNFPHSESTELGMLRLSAKIEGFLSAPIFDALSAKFS